MDEIKGGTVRRIIYSKNGYVVADFETGDEIIKIVGNLPSCREGESFSLRLKRGMGRYGEQYRIISVEEAEPVEKRALIRFLDSEWIKNIGKRRAEAIMGLFGEEARHIVENEPERLAEIKGISRDAAKDIGDSVKENIELLELLEKFSAGGADMEWAVKLYKSYGGKAWDVLSEDPYRILGALRGMDFEQSDGIVKALGIDVAGQLRTECAMKQVMDRLLDRGSVYMPLGMFCEETAAVAGISVEEADMSLKTAVIEGREDLRIDILEDRELVYIERYLKAEKRICDNLKKLTLAGTAEVDIDEAVGRGTLRTDIVLSEGQEKAVADAMKNNVSIVTGGPGTGKTTIISAIVRILEFNGISYKIAAPTGRAAKRITEATGAPTSTVHRMLECYVDENTGRMVFQRNRENPIEAEAIIIDEASMIDLLLMDGLLEAVDKNVRLIIVGDADQLPSVGAGRVLSDMIESDCFTVNDLKMIFRQYEGSLIAENAHRINMGDYPGDGGEDSEFRIIECEREDEIMDMVLELAAKYGAERYGYDPVMDIQVLTPMRKGPAGSRELSKRLREELVPLVPGREQIEFEEHIFREGDKVMQSVNNYQKEWTDEETFEKNRGIYNGDMGIIKIVDPDKCAVQVSFSDEKTSVYSGEELNQLMPAYAVTVHKSQGCEFPMVIIPVTHGLYRGLATRNLLYTAVSRGKEKVVLVGSKRDIYAMVDNVEHNKRNSGLKARLKKTFYEDF